MKIKCSKCGLEVQTNTNQMRALVAKAGSREELGKVFLCRKCKGKKDESAPVVVSSEPLDVDKIFDSMEKKE